MILLETEFNSKPDRNASPNVIIDKNVSAVTDLSLRSNNSEFITCKSW